MKRAGNKINQYVWGFVFLAILTGWAWRFVVSTQPSSVFISTETGQKGFEGNDWVVWEDNEGRVEARRVHPLPSYKSFPPEAVLPGDRLRKIDYKEVYQAEVVEEVSRSSPPGKPFIYQVERATSQDKNPELLVVRVINGFRIAFGFNRISVYWRMGPWIAGIGTFVAFVVFLILFPFFRNDWKTFLPLLVVVGLGLLLFILQLSHYLYLIIESDLVDTRIEEGFTWVFSMLSISYVLAYFFLKASPGHRWLLIPSFGLAGYFLVWLFSVIFLQHALRPYHELVEWLCLVFFLVHTATPVLWAALDDPRKIRQHLDTGLVGLLCLAAIAWFFFSSPGPEAREHALLAFQLLLFFPLAHAAYSRLRFGKVSVVVTRSLQYLVFLGLCLFFFALIHQFFLYLIPNNPYRSLLEIVVLVLGIMSGYALFRSNEARITNYFVTTQQQRNRRIRTFIATIPQYSSSSSLLKALESQIADYFEASPLMLWWKNDEPQNSLLHEDALYRALSEKGTVWSRNKELSPFRGEPGQEEALIQSPYSLVAPLQVAEDRYGLLLLGRKKRGVYNLSDLELLSQLIQQTQLTLNVLQLLQRERELLQQSYEANLTALRSQINPHFLFNTLNTISALVHDSPDLAEEAVEKLAFIFRYTLKFSNQNLVSLENELELVSTYLDIEKIRFGDRLQIQIDVVPEVAQVQIPAFVLQTLVENCIKHGISKIIGKGIVSIEAYAEEDFMVCEVIDNGPGVDPERITKGTGLNNILSRLENIYGIKNLLYFENTGTGTRVELKIPLNL